MAAEVFFDERRLDKNEKAVLLAMAFAADDKERICWAGKAWLVEKTGLSEKTVQRAWRGLEDGGYITRLEGDEDDKKTVSWYLEEGVRETSEVVTQTSGVVTVTTQVVTQTPNYVPPIGGTSPSLRSGEQPELRSGPRLRLVAPSRDASKKINLVAHFQLAMDRAQDEYGVEILGAMDRPALSGCIKRLRASGLDDSDIAAMMDIWAATSQAWNRKIHPSRDFCRKDTSTRLLNALRAQQAADQEYLAPATGSREVLLDEPDPYAGMTADEIRAAIAERDRRALPTWLRKA